MLRSTDAPIMVVYPPFVGSTASYSGSFVWFTFPEGAGVTTVHQWIPVWSEP